MPASQWEAVGRDLRRSAVGCLGRWRQLGEPGRADEGAGGPLPSSPAPDPPTGASDALEPASAGTQFSPEALRRLAALVQRHGRRWTLVARAFGGGVSRQTLMYQWRRAVQRGELDSAPAPRRGKWSEAEDEALQRVRCVFGRRGDGESSRADCSR